MRVFLSLEGGLSQHRLQCVSCGHRNAADEATFTQRQQPVLTPAAAATPGVIDSPYGRVQTCFTYTTWKGAICGDWPSAILQSQRGRACPATGGDWIPMTVARVGAMSMVRMGRKRSWAGAPGFQNRMGTRRS